MIAHLLLLAAATAPTAGTTAGPTAGPTAAPAPAKAAAPGAPSAYAVVQGQHAMDAAPLQTLTVLCPAGRRALGVGYTALVAAPRGAGANPGLVEHTLAAVSHLPEGTGLGWRVSAALSDNGPTGAPATKWSLVVRVVCYAVPR